MSGFPGFFGPVSTHLKAGDLAPDIVFTEILSAPAGPTWSNANLAGSLTVLTIFPQVSNNRQAIGRWNRLVETFREKPVQFVWVASEYQPPLGPWLLKNPVRGWLFLDPLGATGLAYGMEEPSALFIGSDRRILGFVRTVIPDSRTIDAALEGRITTEKVKPGAAAIQAFLESRKVPLEPDPPRMPRPEDGRPDFPPSYTVHITPSKGEGGGQSSAGDYLSFQDLDLKDILMLLYETTRVRIQLPPALDDRRHYDIALVLPERESRQRMADRILRGIEDHFQVAASREELLLDVYVVTSLDGQPPRPSPHRVHSGGSSSSSVEFQVALSGHSAVPPEPPLAVPLADIRGISVEGTADQFCRALEGALDRPVVNETNLAGEFSFRVKADPGPRNDFLERLRDRLRLDVTPDRRPVPVVVLKPR